MNTTVMQRELYSELGQISAAYRIESRRHFDPRISGLLEAGARIVADIRSRYWVGKISPADTLVEMRTAVGILDAVAEWDAS